MGHSKYSVLGLMVLLGVYKNVLIALKSDVKVMFQVKEDVFYL